jgi:ribokinase
MILVAGSANLDFVVRAARIPLAGETVLGRQFDRFPGGKGANQALASARAGNARTKMLLALGSDDLGEPIERSLREAGVELHIVRVSDRSTGTALVCVADNGENAITVAPGANDALDATHLPPLSGVSHLLLQLEIPLATVIEYARIARSQGVKVVLNASPAQTLPAVLLDRIDVLIVNEGELAAVSAELDMTQALARIAVPTVVVTLGARGCMARSHGETIRIAGLPIKPIDTTAAGDTFCGVLAAALDSQLSLPDALRLGNAAAALACTRAGAQPSIPTRDEVHAFLASHVT